ncbi:hypothetical protein GCM10009536_22100 [Streptomyces thermocarboxydus]
MFVRERGGRASRCGRPPPPRPLPAAGDNTDTGGGAPPRQLRAIVPPGAARVGAAAPCWRQVREHPPASTNAGAWCPGHLRGEGGGPGGGRLCRRLRAIVPPGAMGTSRSS